MDIRSFVYQVVDIFPGPLKTPARWVADRVIGVWDDLSHVFLVTIPHWRRISDNITYFMMHAVDAVERAAKGLRWLVTVRIPQAITSAGQAIVNWASQLINDVRQEIIDVRDWLLDKARTFANTVLDYAQRVYQWAADRLTDMWSTLTTVAQLVGALLTDPRKFALWVIGALWEVFWKYTDQHIDAVIEFVWQRRSIVVGRLLTRAESIIERLL